MPIPSKLPFCSGCLEMKWCSIPVCIFHGRMTHDERPEVKYTTQCHLHHSKQSHISQKYPVSYINVKKHSVHWINWTFNVVNYQLCIDKEQCQFERQGWCWSGLFLVMSAATVTANGIFILWVCLNTPRILLFLRKLQKSKGNIFLQTLNSLVTNITVITIFFF